MTDEQAAQRGRKAKDELKIANEAFDQLRDAAIGRLIATSPENERAIQKLHMVLQTLEGVREALTKAVVDGETAEAALAMANLTRP